MSEEGLPLWFSQNGVVDVRGWQQASQAGQAVNQAWISEVPGTAFGHS